LPGLRATLKRVVPGWKPEQRSLPELEHQQEGQNLLNSVLNLVKPTEWNGQVKALLHLNRIDFRNRRQASAALPGLSGL
jgi:hypothetical protein